MYCAKCGQKLNDGSAFCSSCGNAVETRQKPAVVESSHTLKQQGESIERTATLEYITKIRDCELVKDRLQRKINEIDNKISNLCIPRTIKKEHTHHERTFIWVTLALIGWTLLIFFILLSKADWSIFDFINMISSKAAETSQSTMGVSLIIWLPGAVGILLELASMRIRGKNRQASKRADAVYQKALSDENARMNKEKNMQVQLSQEKEPIVAELKKFTQLALQMYRINVIPQKFRSLYPVYFIQEFMATSATPLDQIFLHCDLDKIQSQLSTVIAQNQQMLIQQAITNARLQNIQAQNAAYYERAEEYAKNIEKNSKKAADYAEMASFSSTAGLAFMSSQYL